MKKKLLALLLASSLVLSLAACAPKENKPTTSNPPVQGDNTQQPSQGSDNPLAGTYDITVWVSEIAGVAELTKQQIDAFMAANPGIVINATIEGVTEAESATQMVSSVEDGADIFCFAQDQLARLVMAGALNPLGQATSATVTAENDAGAVAAPSTASP